VARGHGWIGSGDSPEALAAHLAGLKQAAAEVDRPARLGPLQFTFAHLDPATLEAETVRQYDALGLDRLLLYPVPLENPADILAFLAAHAPAS